MHKAAKNIINSRGQTPLTITTIKDFYKIFLLLLAGSDIHIITKDDKILLYHAVMSGGNTKIVKYLIFKLDVKKKSESDAN